VMRNKKYISLRVKLLKKQFGLPADLVSLRSMSLSPALKASTASNFVNNPSVSSFSSSNSTSKVRKEDTSSYNGVHYAIELKTPLASGTRLSFRLLNDQESLFYATENGQIISQELIHPYAKKTYPICETNVTDYDINDSNEILVGAGQDGTFVAWNLPLNMELRRVRQKEGVFVKFCRFLPRNNNLIICALSNGLLQVLNISTGKFSHDCGALMLGKTLAVTLNASGSVLWAANDRGYIESFRIDCTIGKIQKGCRVQANSFNKPVTSLIARTSINKLTRDPCLLATFESSDQLGLYRITDDYGSLVPFRSFSSGSGATLKSAIMAPILSYRSGTLAVAGGEDGSLLFFDLERESRPCINKILGHADPVVALGFSNDEALLASADGKHQIIVWRKS